MPEVKLFSGTENPYDPTSFQSLKLFWKLATSLLRCLGTDPASAGVPRSATTLSIGSLRSPPIGFFRIRLNPAGKPKTT
jgi:hypothetical protein